MNEKRVLNIVLVVIAGLLVLNLGVMLSQSAHAIPKTQYKAVGMTPGPNPAARYQQVLDQQSAQGWEYVDGGDGFMIFKK